MVLPIGFFMPLPLAMMIPFMGIQSAVMAKSFGENFQFGKRRISAMSNEEFNKLTPLKILEQNTRELKSMIPEMEKSVQEMRTFQTFLIREFLRTLNDAIKAGFGELFGINEDTLSNIEHYLHGHGGGHDTPPPPETEPIPCPSGFRWSASAQQCVPEDIPEPTTEPPPTTTTTSTAFIPPIYNENNPVSTQAIGRILAVSTYYQISVHLSSGSWKTLTSKYTSRAKAMEAGAQAWPESTYKTIMVGTTIYYVRYK